MAFDFLKTMESSDTVSPAFNFSPIFDMLNGSSTPGKDGITYTNGGLDRNNAVIGGNNTQKTGLSVLAMIRMLIRYHRSVVFFDDIEGTFDVDRLEEQFDREIGIQGYFRDHILDKRFFYFNKNDPKNPCDGTFVHEQFKTVSAAIRKDLDAKKDVHTLTPFLSNKGEPLSVIDPVFVVVDSVSEMPFQQISAHFQEGNVDDGGEKRTRDLQIGNARRIVYEDADVLGGVVGMVQLWTGQVVDKVNISGRPDEKDSVFIRQGKKIKAPKSFMRIPGIGHEIIKGSVLKAKDGTWQYPNPFGKDVIMTADAKEIPDLMYYNNTPYRNKSGMSGVNAFFIGSQSLGIQEGLTMYHVLKDGMFGMEGSNISHWCILYPELKVGRTTVWEKTLEDRKFLRALTIMYHLWTMNNMWLKRELKYRITPQDLYEKIKARGIDWNDILENTVDYWFTNPDIKKHTVTTQELVRIALGERDPYWIKKAK